jgi:hypothetical protein
MHEADERAIGLEKLESYKATSSFDLQYLRDKDRSSVGDVGGQV